MSVRTAHADSIFIQHMHRRTGQFFLGGGLSHLCPKKIFRQRPKKTVMLTSSDTLDVRYSSVCCWFLIGPRCYVVYKGDAAISAAGKNEEASHPRRPSHTRLCAAYCRPYYDGDCLRKSSSIAATRCHIVRIKCTRPHSRKLLSWI